jgi:Protein of unknown function (DUF5818)
LKKTATSTIAILLLLAVSFAAPAESAFSGEIMDVQCAQEGSHAMMMKKQGAKNAKECTQGCVRMGGKYVLFNAANKRVYQLDDQTKPEQFAGQKVKVKGTYDKATKTIHVTDIQRAS